MTTRTGPPHASERRRPLSRNRAAAPTDDDDRAATVAPDAASVDRPRLPADVEAERALIGAAILDSNRPALLRRLYVELGESSFYDPHCRAVYLALVDVATARQPIEYEPIEHALRRFEAWAMIGEGDGVSAFYDAALECEASVDDLIASVKLEAKRRSFVVRAMDAIDRWKAGTL